MGRVTWRGRWGHWSDYGELCVCVCVDETRSPGVTGSRTDFRECLNTGRSLEAADEVRRKSDFKINMHTRARTHTLTQALNLG